MPEEALPQTALTHSGTSTQAFKPLLQYQSGDVFLAELRVWYQGRSVDPKRILIPYSEASSTAQAIQGDLAAIGFEVDTAPFSTEVVQTNPYDVVMPLCTPDFKTVMAGDGRAVQTLISQAHTVIPLFQGGFGVLPEALKTIPCLFHRRSLPPIHQYLCAEGRVTRVTRDRTRRRRYHLFPSPKGVLNGSSFQTCRLQTPASLAEKPSFRISPKPCHKPAQKIPWCSMAPAVPGKANSR